jgi:hypothetical protein
MNWLRLTSFHLLPKINRRELGGGSNAIQYSIDLRNRDTVLQPWAVVSGRHHQLDGGSKIRAVSISPTPQIFHASCSQPQGALEDAFQAPFLQAIHPVCSPLWKKTGQEGNGLRTFASEPSLNGSDTVFRQLGGDAIELPIKSNRVTARSSQIKS